MKSLLIILLLCHCDNSDRGFYDYSKREDIDRIPLIEPYELISSYGGQHWTMNFANDEFGTNIKWTGTIDSVGVTGNYIVLYNHLSAIPNTYCPVWFVLNSKLKKGQYFITHKEYNQYLVSEKINDLKLYFTDSIFKIFDAKLELPNGWKR